MTFYDEYYFIPNSGHEEWCWWIVWDDRGLWCHTVKQSDIEYWRAEQKLSGTSYFRSRQNYSLFYSYGTITVLSRSDNYEIKTPTNWVLT